MRSSSLAVARAPSMSWQLAISPAPTRVNVCPSVAAWDGDGSTRCCSAAGCWGREQPIAQIYVERRRSQDVQPTNVRSDLASFPFIFAIFRCQAYHDQGTSRLTYRLGLRIDRPLHDTTFRRKSLASPTKS